MFENFNFNDFWEESKYAQEKYEGSKITQEMIVDAENHLGYKLPASYIYLLNKRNGGIPTKFCCPTHTSTSWANNHVQINAIFGIDKTKYYSIFRTGFWVDEWGYPDIGMAICDCPSAGHDMIFLDYRECGPQGEPTVVHVDQELNYKITILAKNFEEFIKLLTTEDEFE